jgi:transcriptional regulator with XRE-family HTH domain
MNLAAFMKQVGATGEDVALAVGRDRATISRIRRGLQAPSFGTLMLLNEWARNRSAALDLKPHERLEWPHPGKGSAA